MANLFSGMEAFGFDNLKDMDIYAKEVTAKKEVKEVAQPVFVEADFLFDKTFTCPVCDSEFKSKMIKAGKVKLMAADTDLRPKYQYIDSLKYDAIVCPKCGYSALNRFFNYMSLKQAKIVKEMISSKFSGINTKDDTYTYEVAITRHKLALMNSIVTNGKHSERAYTCLKIAWLLRGKAENLDKDTPDYENVIKAIKEEENEFILNAYEGFNLAFSKENFPMCGMDENTSVYLVADLARRSGKYNEASRLISQVLIAKSASDRIKTKAREIKELMKSELSGK